MGKSSCLHHACAENIVHVQDAHRVMLVILDDQSSDFFVFHYLQGLSGKHVPVDGCATAVHGFADRSIVDINVLINCAT